MRSSNRVLDFAITTFSLSGFSKASKCNAQKNVSQIKKKEIDGLKLVARQSLFLAISAGPRGQLALSRSILKSVLDRGGPETVAGVNDCRRNSDEAGDDSILQSLHAGLVREKALDHFHFDLLLR
jgi:hypothetical protein